MKAFTVRPAKAADYPAFTKLFPELGTDDAIPGSTKWEAELMANTWVAEREGRVIGYIYYQTLQGAGYIRNVVVAPDARRMGIGKQLMEVAASRLLEVGICNWRLNVMTYNTPAIKLYESLGMEKQYESTALKLRWELIEKLPSPSSQVRALSISPDEDERVEQHMKLITGQLADARTKAGRILTQLQDENSQIVGAAIFDPAFPGAFPFRVASPNFVGALLHALRRHARPEHDFINLVIEADGPLRNLLVHAGATVRSDFLHFYGAL